MLRLVAKDYANWDRNDTEYPFFRTFDPWAGHSFAGGMGDGNGNGQESTSEAMQSWGGLYLLGVALGDDEMRDAGIFGWLSEARGVAEYWFDRHRDNINYEKYKHPYNSNLTCHGVGWWTYFGYQNLYMQGIQWMPTSTALDYLSEDKEFAKWDYNMLFTDPAKTESSDASNGNWFEDRANSLDKSGDWGNVTLSYLQRSDPDEAARLFDVLWERNIDIARTSSTNGISYFSTHSHLTNGDLDWTVTANIPTARVYKKADGTKTHIVYNPTDHPITVSFSDGFTLSDVPARQLKVEGQESKAVKDIVTEAEPVDVRESLQMPNLALHKPCVASSFENVGTVVENATDGDDNSRWGSEHRDGEWIQVDLQQEVSLYQVKIHWEAAFASNYTIALSEDGENWTYQQEVNCVGGWDAVKLGDRKARYIRIIGNKRATSYGISLYEIQAFGKPLNASSDAIQGVQILADKDVLKQYEPSKITVKGYTNDGKWVDVNVRFSSPDGSISDNGIFVPSTYGTAQVGANLDAGVTAETFTQSFPVEEALYVRYVKLAPSNVQVIADGTPCSIEVETQDQFQGVYDLKPNDMVYDFYAGVADKDGKFMAAPVADADIYYDEATKAIIAHKTGIYSMVAHVAGKESVADTLKVEALNFEDINLAYHKPTTASSQNGEGSGPEKVVDGDATGSRWESVWKSDDENLTVDLGQNYLIHKVIVFWENARAKEYLLQVSNDGESWQTVKTAKDSPVGGETLEFAPVEARFVRIQGVSRVMEAYGYSIYELQVYGKGVSTGIGHIEQQPIHALDAVYDLNGIRHSDKMKQNNAKGIYIIGKKKVAL